MQRLIPFLPLSVLAFTFINRGGGPLLSHLVLVGATFVVALLVVIFRGKMKVRFGLAEAGYTLFFAWFVISLFFSRTPSYGLNELLLFGACGILYFIFRNLDISESELRWFAIILIGLVAADILAGYFVYISTPIPRFVGTFLDFAEPYTAYGNDFADLILLVLPLAAWMLCKPHPRRTTTLLSILSFAILLSGFVLGFSRGAWFSAATGIVLLIMWILFQRAYQSRFERMIDTGKNLLGLDNFASAKTIIFRSIAVLVLTVVLIQGVLYVRTFATPSLLDKLAFRSDEGLSSIETRKEYWRASLQLIKERPLFGHGVWSFRFVFPQYQSTFGIADNHPHNLLLKIAVENGIPALFGFLLFIFGIAIDALPKLWHARWHAALFFFLGSMAAFGHNLLDYNFISSNFLIFILLLAFGGAAISPREKSQTTHPLFVICLMLSTIIFSLAIYESYFQIDFKKGRQLVAIGKIDDAISRLERSKALIFERDRYRHLGAAYYAKFDATKDAAWREKEHSLLSSLTEGSLDPAFYARLGELAYEGKNFVSAEEYYLKALQLDPMNRFRYYFQYLSLLGELGKSDEQIMNRARGLLSGYEDILKYNRNFTILTSNPEYAVKLHELFGNTEGKKRLETLWFDELIKFAKRYGGPAVSQIPAK